jgi:eukaryotic-like serine/threonine-protein kinase
MAESAFCGSYNFPALRLGYNPSESMALNPGTKLGPYEIQSLVGAGGMGEVYRAHDARLDRIVAIKILPVSFSADPDRLQRFAQEARAAAALNHPNILSIFDIGDNRGAPYVVSELLEGETLRDCLNRGPMSVRKAIDYALQVARGLAAAHEKGIVHRDLKPENLFITNDGRVKILDFGLAKLTRPELARESGDAPTIQAVTEPGVVMGTVGYMSPEQVRGKDADARSDIFSFGAILYEMISGKRAFHGETAADTMSAILKEEPPELAETARNVPPALECIVRHCLEKNPAQRFHSISDVAFGLEVLTGISSTTTSGAQRVAPVSERRGWLLSLGAAVALCFVLAVVYLAGQHSAGMSIPHFHRLTFRRGTILSARFSPDGQTIIYGAALEGRPTELLTTRFDSTDSRSLGLEKTQLLSVSANGELAVSIDQRQFSPFTAAGTMGRVPLAGGAPREVAEEVSWADWTPDGSDLAVAKIAGRRIDLEFPVGKMIYQPRGWVSHVRFSPRGDLIAIEDHVPNGDDGRVVILDRKGNIKVASSFFITVQGLAWSPDGKEVWFTASKEGASRALYAMNLSGKERLVLRVPGVLTLQDITRSGRALLTVESDHFGVLGFHEGDKNERDLSWFDWSLVGDLSPDGKNLIFFESGEGVGSNYSVFMRGMDGSPAVRLGTGEFPALSPDGKWVAAINLASPAQIELLPTGAGQPRVVTNDSLEHTRVRWVPSGRGIVFSASETNHAPRTYWMDLGSGKTRVVTPEGIVGLLVSPDGNFVLARDSERKLWLYPIEGGDRQPFTTTLAPGDDVIDWEKDGKSILVLTPGIPAKVVRVYLGSSKVEEVKSFSPSDPAGVVTVGGTRFSSDRKSYAYDYFRILSDLYVVDGLR